jgi:BR serine/threonine kinase
MSFKVEYRRGTSGPAMFQRHVRFNVDIAAIGQHETKGERCAEIDILYAVTFVLIAGNKNTMPLIVTHILYIVEMCVWNSMCRLRL